MREGPFIELLGAYVVLSRTGRIRERIARERRNVGVALALRALRARG